MASEYTKNYSFDLYTDNDKPNLRDQYNAAITKIDKQLHANATAISNNATAIADETTRATQAEQTNATAIADETTRATQAEQTNATAIADETTRATQAEQTNATAIDAEKTRAEDAEQTLQVHVDEIAQRKYVRSFSTLDNLLAENIPVGRMAFVSGNGFIASYTIAAQKHNDYDSYQMSNGNYAILNINNGELIFDSVNDIDRINGIISTGAIGTLKFLPKKYNLSGEIVSINDISIVGNNTVITGLTFSINLNGDTWARIYPIMALTMRGIQFEDYDKVPVKCGGAMQFIDCTWRRTKSCAANVRAYVDNVRFIRCTFVNLTQRFIVCQVNSPDNEWLGYGDNNVFENCASTSGNSNAYATFNGSHTGVLNNCINLGVKIVNNNSKVVISNSHYEAPIIIGDVPIGSTITINDCYICCVIDRPFYTKDTVRFNNCVWYINNNFTFGNKYPNESPLTVYGNNNIYADTKNTGGFYDEYHFSFITPAKDLTLQKIRNAPDTATCFLQEGTYDSMNGKSNFPDGVGTYTYNIYPSVLSSEIIGATRSLTKHSFTVDIEDTSNSAMHVLIERSKNIYYHIYRTSPNGNIYKAVISASHQIIIDRGNFIQGVFWTKVNNIPTDIIIGTTSMIGGLMLAPDTLSSAPNISGILCVKPDGTILQGPRSGA